MSAPADPGPEPEPGPAPGLAVCSAKGCAEDAAWALLWNNPRIHAESRRKQWLACVRHRESLEQFLTLRGFLREVQAFGR